MIQLFRRKNVNGWKQSGHGLLTLFLVLALGPALYSATPLGRLVNRDGGARNHDVKIWVSRTIVFISKSLNIVWLNITGAHYRNRSCISSTPRNMSQRFFANGLE